MGQVSHEGLQCLTIHDQFISPQIPEPSSVELQDRQGKVDMSSTGMSNKFSDNCQIDQGGHYPKPGRTTGFLKIFGINYLYG